MMQHTTLSIVGELTYPIEHCILTAVLTELSRIKTSTPIPRCSSSAHYPVSWKGRATRSATSSSARMKVKELVSPEAAAIGSATRRRALWPGHAAEQLANQKENYSRFIVVARKPIDRSPRSRPRPPIMSTSEAGLPAEALRCCAATRST